jgi:uncharacterized cupredoxin-like copper-binding protein
MRPRVLTVLILVALLVAACSGGVMPSDTPSGAGVAAAPASATVTPSVAPSVEPSAAPPSAEIPVVMLDTMRFEPDPMTVKAGVEVTFVVKNDGAAVHEFFVGTEEEQAEHAEEMAMGGMSHGHDNALSLKGGETGTLKMTFAKSGSLLVGCHEPGHYEAGMKAALTVAD